MDTALDNDKEHPEDLIDRQQSNLNDMLVGK